MFGAMRMRHEFRHLVAWCLCAIVGSAFATTDANAVTYGFDNISANSVADAGIGEAQLFVDVTDAGGGQVSFNFYNTGPSASSIADVYFEDGSLLALSSLIDADEGVGGDAGVDFSPLASPGNLPSANSASPPFVTTAGFSADSDPPVQPNGVNPGESLIVLFTLQGGQTFGDVTSELATAALRIGIHVQGFESGGSESFVNDPTCIDCGGPGGIVGEAPIPAALPLFISGLAGMGLIGWRKRRRVA
jgi:hypothetical protein